MIGAHISISSNPTHTARQVVHTIPAQTLVIAIHTSILLLQTPVVLLLLRRRVGSGRGLRLRVCVVGLGVWVVLPVGLLVGVLVREDVLHRHLRARMQSPSPRGGGLRGCSVAVLCELTWSVCCAGECGCGWECCGKVEWSNKVE